MICRGTEREDRVGIGSTEFRAACGRDKGMAARKEGPYPALPLVLS